MRQVNMDSFPSSMTSIEGVVHAVVIVDECTEFRWIYAIIRHENQRRNARVCQAMVQQHSRPSAKISSRLLHARQCRREPIQGDFDFLNSHGIRSHFSEAHEPWQNGSADSTIDSIMLLAKTIMAESGAAGRFWFRTAVTGKDARNATHNTRLGTSQHAFLYGEPRDVSRFRAFGCRAYVHLNQDSRNMQGRGTRQQPSLEKLRCHNPCRDGLLVGCNMHRIVNDPFDIIRMPVQDVNRVVHEILVDDGCISEREHVFIELCLVCTE
jgi:hypothetical protein